MTRPEFEMLVNDAVTLLHEMFLKGDMLVFLSGDNSKVGGGRLFERLHELDCFFVPEPAQIESALLIEVPPESRLVCAMAPRGAARWEEETKPDWAKYVRATSYIVAGTTDHETDLRGPWDRIEHALSKFFPEAARIAGTERWDAYSPWYATYWKTLPAAVGVKFRIPVYAPPMDLRDSWIEFLTWYQYPEPLIEPVRRHPHQFPSTT